MKLKLLRDTKPFGRTGEIVEPSPDGCEWLLSLGFAVPVAATHEQIETPEEPKEPSAVKAAPVKAAKTARKKGV